MYDSSYVSIFMMFLLFRRDYCRGRGWSFVGAGCHKTFGELGNKNSIFLGPPPSHFIKGAELNLELDYTISFWLWIISWKSPHLLEISPFHGYYLHFMEISTFCGYYLHFMDLYVFRGYYPHFVEISMLRRYYPHFVEISTSCGYYLNFVDICAFCVYYPHFVDIIRIGHIKSYLACDVCHRIQSFVLVVDIIYIDQNTSYLARNVRYIFYIDSFSKSDWCMGYNFLRQKTACQTEVTHLHEQAYTGVGYLCQPEAFLTPQESC